MGNPKQWLLGTYHGVSRAQLQVYLDEFVFRHNRRKTNGVARIAARVIEGLVASKPLSGRMLVEKTTPCRWFDVAQPELSVRLETS